MQVVKELTDEGTTSTARNVEIRLDVDVANLEVKLVTADIEPEDYWKFFSLMQGKNDTPKMVSVYA